MTPQPKGAKIPRSLILLGSLIPIAAAVAGVARAVKTTTDSYATKTGVESTYVRKDSFALTHQRDSLNESAEFRALRNDVGALVRACQRRRECP